MVDLKLNIPDTYYREEVRWGYTIPTKMKKVWAVMLDLFAEFDRVCKKHQISYLASGGTMLGAVRHKGFIPWDDDMDLMMRREDYDKLCKIAPSEFRHPYFFQTYETDRGYTRAYAKLRNSNTTAIQENRRDMGYTFNQGIFLDIFPLDNISPNKVSAYFQSIKCNYYLQQALFSISARNGYRMKHQGKLYHLDAILYRFLGKSSMFDGDINMEKLITNCKKYQHKKTPYSSKLAFQPKNRQQIVLNEDISNPILLDFEFLKIPVPQNYEIILRRRYGDYMKPLQTGGYHGTTFFDVDKSYKEYVA